MNDRPIRPRSVGARAAARRAQRNNRTEIPPGLLFLVVATAILIAVPIARATVPAEGTEAGSATGGSALQSARAVTPLRVSGRVIRSATPGSARVRLRVRGGDGRRHATVRLRVKRIGARKWKTVARERVRIGSLSSIVWRDATPGRYSARITTGRGSSHTSDRLGRLMVYRQGFASWYGPGLYGGALACGGRLKPSTVGVAHKTLPCGTRVTFRLGRRTVTAPVIDRGPFVSGREWDLTAGLKQRLRFGSTGSVWATH